MDVFTGQMTPQVIQHYAESNILIVNVPRNMTKYYQPLDLTVNGYSKRFLKNKFNEWYSFQVSKQLAEGVMLENVQVKLNLTILKPIHAGWLVEFYNHMTTDKGCNIIKDGWKATGITDAIRLGLNDLPSVILSMKWILCCSSLLHLPIKINLWRFQELLLTKFK